MNKSSKYEVLRSWMITMIDKLKNNRDTITLGWLIIEKQIKEQYEKHFITKEDYYDLHNEGLDIIEKI